MSVLIVLYILVILVLVFYLGRRVNTSEDFFLAGRKLTWIVVAGSMLATATGGATVIAYPGAFYSIGFDWYFMPLALIVSALFVGFFVAERVRALSQYTVPQLLSLRYDGNTRTAAAVLYVIADIAVICTQILAFSGILAGYLGVPMEVAAIIGVVLFILTAMGGGLVGVAFTDAIQAGIIAIGLIVVAVLVALQGGGLGNIFAQLPENYFTPFSVLPGTTILGNVIALIGLTLASQSIIFHRINAAKSPQAAKRSVLMFAVSMFCLLGIVIPVIGYSAYVVLGPGIAQGEVTGAIIATVLPPWAGGLFVAVIVGAILTTTNSILLSTSMNVIKDLYEGALKKEVTDKVRLTAGRLTVLVVGILAYLMTRSMPSIVAAVVFAYTMTSVLAVPIYCGLLWKRPTALSGLLSIVLGGSVTLLWQFVFKMPWGIHSAIAGILAALVGLFIGFLAKPISEEQWQSVQVDKTTVSS